MGNFIVLGVWGEEFFYKYLMFTFGTAIWCYSRGVYMLIPKDKNAGFTESLKSVYVATMLRLIVLPALMMLVLKFSGATEQLMILTLCLSSLCNAQRKEL